MTAQSVREDLLRSGRWSSTDALADFTVQQLGGLVTVRGTVPVADARVVVDDTGRPVSVHASLEPGLLSTGNARRDKDLRSRRFLDTSAWPTWTFTSRSITPDGLGWAVDGTLEVRGTRCPLHLMVTATARPDGSVDVEATGELDRRKAGVSAGPGFVIGHRIAVHASARLVNTVVSQQP
jgi:polyisoprenoid-binding protein YceI